MFADIKVVPFHLDLGAGNGFGNQPAFQGIVVVDARPAHHIFEAVAAEALHQFVLQGDKELAAAGVALASGAAPQLVVHPAGFVVFGADDMEAAQGYHPLVFLVPAVALGVAAAEDDVGAAPGHIGGNGNGAGAPGLGYDAGLLFVVAGVQHLVGDALPAQALAQCLGGFNRSGADQHRLPGLGTVDDVVHHGAPLALGGGKNQVGGILADHRQVGGNGHRFQAVNLIELVGFGDGGAGHSGQLAVHTEVVLQGNGGVGNAFPLDFQALFGFYRLVQAVGPAASVLEAAGEFVHDDNFAVLDHIVFIADFLHLGNDGIFNVLHQVEVGGVVEVVHPCPAFHLGNARFG